MTNYPVDWNYVERAYREYLSGDRTRKNWQMVAEMALESLMEERKDVLERLKESAEEFSSEDGTGEDRTRLNPKYFYEHGSEELKFKIYDDYYGG